MPETIPWRRQDEFKKIVSYTCGHCGLVAAGKTGFWRFDIDKKAAAPLPLNRIYLCPFCSKPTYFEGERQIPGVPFGADVQHLPGDIAGLYREVRNCVAVEAYTAGAMACRKILMNVAVSQGSPKPKDFKQAVDYLEAKGYLPPNGKKWVTHIKDKGNEAAHEIPATSREDLTDLIVFLEMLLKFIFEYPKRV